MASTWDAVKNFVEPTFIVSAFTIGSLINRRRRNREHTTESGTSSPYADSDSPLLEEAAEPIDLFSKQPADDKLITRFLWTFPFLIEIWYWNLTYWVYQLLRALSARLIAGNEAIFAVAQSHALQVLHLEERLGIAFERPIQQYILKNAPQLMPILAKVYYSHIGLGVCFIIYTYTVLPPTTYRRIRRTLPVDNGIAFLIITAWRCMPPRMLPSEYGFKDILHGGFGGGTAWTHNRFQLTIAAMPSLHFGTSLFLAWSICRFSPHRFLRIVAPLWPAMMLLTIVSTANHFILDAAVGAMVPIVGWKLNRVILVFMPLQDWLVGVLWPQKKEEAALYQEFRSKGH